MNNKQEKKVIPSTPNYYSNYLKVELRKMRDKRLFDEQFINERVEQASEEWERQRRAGISPFSAQELAMKVLLEGVSEN